MGFSHRETTDADIFTLMGRDEQGRILGGEVEDPDPDVLPPNFFSNERDSGDNGDRRLEEEPFVLILERAEPAGTPLITRLDALDEAKAQGFVREFPANLQTFEAQDTEGRPIYYLVDSAQDARDHIEFIRTTGVSRAEVVGDDNILM